MDWPARKARYLHCFDSLQFRTGLSFEAIGRAVSAAEMPNGHQIGLSSDTIMAYFHGKRFPNASKKGDGTIPFLLALESAFTGATAELSGTLWSAIDGKLFQSNSVQKHQSFIDSASDVRYATCIDVELDRLRRCMVLLPPAIVIGLFEQKSPGLLVRREQHIDDELDVISRAELFDSLSASVALTLEALRRDQITRAERAARFAMNRFIEIGSTPPFRRAHEGLAEFMWRQCSGLAQTTVAYDFCLRDSLSPGLYDLTFARSERLRYELGAATRQKDVDRPKTFTGGAEAAVSS